MTNLFQTACISKLIDEVELRLEEINISHHIQVQATINCFFQIPTDKQISLVQFELSQINQAISILKLIQPDFFQDRFEDKSITTENKKIFSIMTSKQSP